jgi:hypothetical protein
VRFERTARFKADFQRLPATDRELFRRAVRELNAACDRFVETRDPAVWPASLRVKAVTKAPGVFELTRSFSVPDGRATWEFSRVADADGREWPAVGWRRLGDHKILRQP